MMKGWEIDMRRIVVRTLFILVSLCMLLPGYASAEIRGKVIDFSTKKPIPGAIITGNSEIVLADSDGAFVMKNATDKLWIRAYGYGGELTGTFARGRKYIEIGLNPLYQKAFIFPFTGSATGLSVNPRLNSLIRQASIRLS
jgi:hypothetical protein